MSAKRAHRAGKAKHRAMRKKPTRASKSLARRSRPASKPLDDFIDAAARVLDLKIDAAWKPAIAAHLEATLRLAALVMNFPLADDAEPAPIFTA